MISIVLSVLGSTAVFGFITFLIQRRDEKKNDLGNIKDKIEKIERDQCRIQLMMLINHFPKNKSEILAVAEHYFTELEGNWYMSEIFSEYCSEHDIECPIWLRRD